MATTLLFTVLLLVAIPGGAVALKVSEPQLSYLKAFAYSLAAVLLMAVSYAATSLLFIALQP